MYGTSRCAVVDVGGFAMIHIHRPKPGEDWSWAEELLLSPIYLTGNTLCGKRGLEDRVFTIELYIVRENLMSEEFCEECLEHPDFSLLALARLP